MDYCLQIQNDDCGFACIKMLLAYFYKNKNYLFITQDIKHGRYSMLDLKEIAQKEGLFCDGYKYNTVTENKKFPCIGHLQIDNKNHFIIIEKVTKKYVKYFDPCTGINIKSIEEFDEISSQNYLVYAGKREYKKIDNSNFFKTHLDLLQMLLGAIQFGSLFYLSFNNKNFSISIIICLTIYLLGIVGSYFINVKYMKKYDQNIIYSSLSLLPKDEDNLSKKVINNEYQLKKKYFLNNNNLFSLMTLTTFIIFVLMINDYKNIVGIGIIVLFNIAKKYYFIAKNNPILERIKKEEKQTGLEIKDKYSLADELSYSYAENYKILEIIEITIIILFSLALGFMNKNFTSLVYYIIFYKFLSEKINEALSFQKNRLEEEQMINYHLSAIEYYQNNSKNIK